MHGTRVRAAGRCRRALSGRYAPRPRRQSGLRQLGHGRLRREAGRSGEHDFRLPLHGESVCGRAPATLKPGTTMRIFTGAPLPVSADTVVIQEDIHEQDGRDRFPPSIKAGQHIRPRRVFPASLDTFVRVTRLNAWNLALLSTAGIDKIDVFRRARVLVVATGNEAGRPRPALAARSDLRIQPARHAACKFARSAPRRSTAVRCATSPMPCGYLAKKAGGFADRTRRGRR